MRQSALTIAGKADTTAVTRHYLLIQPVASAVDDAKVAAREIAAITGQDNYTVLQNIVGHAPDVLLISQDGDATNSACNKLRDAGFVSAVVPEDLLRRNPSPQRAVAISSRSATSIVLASINGNTVCEIDETSNPFVVVGALNPALYGAGREIMRHIVGCEHPVRNTADIRLKDISKNSPAALIYQEMDERPAIIVGAQFNYQSLNVEMKYSVAANFNQLLSAIRDVPGARIDVSFGQKTLPLTPLASRPEDEKDTLERLRVYGRLMWLSKKNGFGDCRESSPEPSAPALPLKSTISPLMPGVGLVAQISEPPETTHRTISASASTKEPSLPPAPPPLKHSGAFQFNLAPRLQLKNFGPPALVGGLIALTIISAGFSVLGGAFSLVVSAIPGGLFLCVWALSMLLRKRAIEQLPTSRIRSLPMGTVELYGEACRKYDLIAPYSLTKCVYYSYEVLHLKISGYNDGRPVERWVVTERGESGRAPFYLRDDTGKVTVDPTGAIISGMQAEEYAGGMLETLAGVKGDGRSKIVERVIPEGAKLYVIGHARPRKNSAREARDEYRGRLRALKASPKLLAKYDSDGDGHISVEEFAEARADLEQKMSEERLASQSLPDNSKMKLPADRINESVVVGDNPNNGLFYISNKSELDILKGYAWRIPLVAITGFLVLLWGVMNILGNQ